MNLLSFKRRNKNESLQEILKGGYQCNEIDSSFKNVCETFLISEGLLYNYQLSMCDRVGNCKTVKIQEVSRTFNKEDAKLQLSGCISKEEYIKYRSDNCNLILKKDNGCYVWEFPFEDSYSPSYITSLEGKDYSIFVDFVMTLEIEYDSINFSLS